MPATHAPVSEAEVAELVLATRTARTSLVISGGNTRADLGRPMQTAADLSLSALSGITLYEPSEMVIAARTGTPLREITEALAARNQMLPFEPMDHRPLFASTGEPTIGGVVATNASGPRRIATGAARDHLIGVRFINGLGEAIKSGGRVMKNVTGLDLVKLQCGAHGTLGVLTEATFKVLPCPERSATLVLPGLEDAAAIAALSRALGSPFDVNGAAHLPAALAGAAQTLLRVEGFAPSVDYRLAQLKTLLDQPGAAVLEGDASRTAWLAIRDCTPLCEPRGRAVWRISLAATGAPVAMATIARMLDTRHFYDWGGGLVWLSVPQEGDAAHADAGAARLRAVLAPLGGHATLVRAGGPVRLATPVFPPLSAPVMHLTAGIKRSFDPDAIFNPGRMYAGV